MARPKDAEKQGLIIAAAFEVFGAQGYQPTKITDIAARAGIASGTVYTYFRDKEDLFRATVEEGWRRFLLEMESIVDSEAPAERRLARFVELGFTTLQEVLPLLRGMLFESHQMNLLERNLERLSDLIERLLADRDRHSPPPAREARSRRSLVRISVVGVLFSAALAQGERVDEQIREIRRTVELMLFPNGRARATPRRKVRA